MKKCCYIPANLRAYGSRNKVVKAFNGLLQISYITYLRCKKCKSQLRGEVVKTVHDREASAVAA